MLFASRLSLATCALAVGALLPCGLAASAQTVVHDNFGPGDTFNTIGGYTESGPFSLTGTQSTGFGFTPGVSGTLFDLTVAIGHVSGTNDAHVFLSDGTSGVPGTTLETFTLTNLPASGTAFTPETLSSVLHPLLTAGTTYYLYEQESDEANMWKTNNTGDTGPRIVSFNNSTYSTFTDTLGAFRVRVNPAAVPEPGSIALLAGIGTVGAGFLRRRKLARNAA